MPDVGEATAEASTTCAHRLGMQLHQLAQLEAPPRLSFDWMTQIGSDLIPILVSFYERLFAGEHRWQ